MVAHLAIPAFTAEAGSAHEPPCSDRNGGAAHTPKPVPAFLWRIFLRNGPLQRIGTSHLELPPQHSCGRRAETGRGSCSGSTSTSTGMPIDVITVNTKPIDGQRPGTSGLRKKTAEASEGNYLPNFIQVRRAAPPSHELDCQRPVARCSCCGFAEGASQRLRVEVHRVSALPHSSTTVPWVGGWRPQRWPQRSRVVSCPPPQGLPFLWHPPATREGVPAESQFGFVCPGDVRCVW